MGGTGTLSLIKTLFIPALISLILYLLSTFVLIPLWQRYHQRYSQYLPLSSLSAHTSSWRERIQSGLARIVFPSWSWGERLRGGGERMIVIASGVGWRRRERGDEDDGDDNPGRIMREGLDSDDEEEGLMRLVGGDAGLLDEQEMGVVSEDRRRRIMRALEGGARRTRESDRRLSRDLEQVFMDDSDDD